MLCVRPNIHSNTVEETAGILLQTPLKKTVPKKDEARVRLSGRALGVSVGWFLSPPRNVTVFSFDPLSMHQQVSCNRITPTLSVSFSLFCFFFSSPSSLQFKCLEGIKTEDSRFFARTYESATGSTKEKSSKHLLLLMLTIFFSLFSLPRARDRDHLPPFPPVLPLWEEGEGGWRG